MRTFSIVLILAIAITCSTQAGEIAVVLRANMHGQALQLGTTYSMDGGKYFFKPALLRYYISGISFVHHGNQRTNAENVYLLVDVAKTDRYVIGNYDISSIDSLIFHIGVERLFNHQDPTLYPEGHPLSLQDPSMHWGWAAGYRFITLEGSAGSTPTTARADVQLHSVGDTLYRRIAIAVSPEVDGNTLNIVLNAEYGNLLDGIDASLGVILHGYGKETIALTDNMAQRVFTSATTSSVSDVDHSVIPLLAFPQPISTDLHISYGTQSASVRLINTLGESVLETLLPGGQALVNVAHLPPGRYTLVVQPTNATPFSHAPVLITR